MADLWETLNTKQREAVLETEGYVRVIAGAGSGKTKLLVSRYAYLVSEYGIDAGNILCVTFTNKAAEEMKSRIRRLIGDGNDVSLICTYHGFCHRLLRENPEKLFLSRQFQIIDSRQQKHIWEEIYQKHDLKLNYATFEAMLKKTARAKRDMEYVKKICCPAPCQILRELKNPDDLLIEEFLQKQKATHSLDFQDLIAFALYLLENDPEIRAKWQKRLNYIMVDEFQDSSSTEMRLVEILSGLYRNLMIVGDPDQNIYEWRGSDVKLLVDFDKEHEPTKTIILNQNYRSTPQILQCANSLIEKNKLRLKKDLFTDNSPGAPVTHYHSKDEYEEADQVVRNIKRLHESEGLPYSHFAIIYRASFLSRIMEKKLAEKNIPYEIFGGIRFYQRMEILDILAYLKLIAFDDDDSFLRVVNTPRRKFGRQKMNYLEELRKQGTTPAASLFSTLSAHLEDKAFAGSDVENFVRFIEGIRSRYSAMRISDIVNTVAEGSGYENFMRELGDEERLSNLVEFKRISNEFEREFGEYISLEEFLNQIALQSGEDRSESRDTVKLMTIHSSKGLEFPAVFILGFTEGIFPSAKTLGERKNPGLEEERRLCYVAITRAEKYLFLMESEGTSENGAKKLVSRFLEEIGEQNYVRVGQISENLRQASKKYAAKLDWEMQLESAGSRKVGDVVEHHIFGPGIIEAIDEKRGSYSIRFHKFEQPRDISSSYFMKKHENLCPGQEETANAPIPVISSPPVQKNQEEAGTGMEFSPPLPQRDQKVDRDRMAVSPPLPQRDQEVDRDGMATSPPLPQRDQGMDRNGMAASPPPARKVLDSGQPPRTPPETAVARETLNGEDEAAGRLSNPDQPEQEDGAGQDRKALHPTDISKDQTARLKTLKENSPNLWKDPRAPHSGWTCAGVEDLGAPSGICQMCGYQIIRYAHLMEHPNYHSLSVGCVCAGRMEGDVAEAKRREAAFKNRQTRRINFCKRQWKYSRKGNEYLKVDNHVVVLYHHTEGKESWKYSIDNEFCGTAYSTRERAVEAVFEALEQMRSEK